ncbi:MAG: PAS domain S-box protein, partial [Candidatus Omnitrophota bacterium]
KVELKTNDELTDLATAFNDMVIKLKSSMVSLELLKTSQKRFQDVAESTSDWIWEIDAQGRYTYSNSGVKKLLGYEIEEILGKYFYDFIHPDDREALKNEFFKALAKQQIIENLVNRNLKKDGQLVFIETNGTPVLNYAGDLIGYRGADRNITERKQAEEKLTQAFKEEMRTRGIMISMLSDNNRVNEKLEESLKKLQKAQGHLIHAEKMDAIGRMASGVAHEVKNPLGIILQGINYFEGALLPEAKDNREILQMMKDSVKRADNIVRTLLDFSRAEELATELQEINTVIRGSLDLMQHRFKLNSIEVVCELAEGLPKVAIHKGKIEQVFINLLDNAVDIMSNGGKIYIRSYLSELETAEDKVGDRENDTFRLGEEALIVEVEDTGPGMDVDIKIRVFDPFFTTKNRTEGTGLGLSVAKGIMEMHSGIIKVESEKGKGAKFILVFKIPHLRKEQYGKEKSDADRR